jgi:hypothetical protein
MRRIFRFLVTEQENDWKIVQGNRGNQGQLDTAVKGGRKRWEKIGCELKILKKTKNSRKSNEKLK